MKEFYQKLDEACLDAVSFLRAVVNQASQNIHDKDWRNDGVNAAKGLLSKAPERLADADGEKFQGAMIYLPKRNDPLETT